MTTASTPYLRPLSLAQILDQSVRLYRINFLKFIAILAIPYIPLIGLQLVSSLLLADSMNTQIDPANPYGILTQPSYLSAISGSLLFIILYFFLISGVATASLTRAVADSYTGLPIGVLASYRRLGKTWLRLLGALFAAFVLGLVATIWMIIPCVGWLTGPGLVVFLGSIVFRLVVPVVVLEEQGVLGSLRRAWDLARSRFWWLLGFALILYLLSMILVSGPTLLIQSLFSWLRFSETIPYDEQLRLSTVVESLVNLTASLIYLPLQLIAITVVYFDLRVRSEGLDLAMQASGTQGREAIAALPAVQAPVRRALITGQEIGYFILLSLAGVALYFLLVGLVMGMMLALVPY